MNTQKNLIKKLRTESNQNYFEILLKMFTCPTSQKYVRESIYNWL